MLNGLIGDRMTLAVGGFDLRYIPEVPIATRRDTGKRELTIASNNASLDGLGVGLLLA